MSDELFRPIDPDTARAIEHAGRAVEETAKVAGAVVDADTAATSYTAGVLGRIPHNLFGLIDDRLDHYRIRRWAELCSETREHLNRWGAKEPFEEIIPSVATSLLEVALNETRDGLKQIWDRLVAAARHPGRKELVRQSLISIVKRMDPASTA